MLDHGALLLLADHLQPHERLDILQLGTALPHLRQGVLEAFGRGPPSQESRLARRELTDMRLGQLEVLLLLFHRERAGLRRAR